MMHGLRSGLLTSSDKEYKIINRKKSEPVQHGCRSKVVVVGDGHSGKTSLLVSYVEGKFPDVYVPTVFDTHVVNIQIHESCRLEMVLWDTAGQENYDMLRPVSYPNTDVFLICYTIDNPDSFLNVCSKWLPEVRHFCPEVPIILVGTKTDTRSIDAVVAKLAAKKQRPVYPEEGIELARKIGAFAYVECSAKRSEGVEEVFATAARAAIVKQARTPRRRTPNEKQCVIL